MESSIQDRNRKSVISSASCRLYSDYKYNLQWDKVTKLTTKVQLDNNEGENDEDSDDEERLVPHNWKTDSESSDSD